jgi:hypothetical protein
MHIIAKRDSSSFNVCENSLESRSENHYGSVTAQLNMNKNQVFGYAASLKATRELDMLDAFCRRRASLKVCGPVFHMNRLHGIALNVGSLIKKISPAFVYFIDCSFLKIYSHAVSV